MLKKTKFFILAIIITIFIVIGTFLIVNILNADFYGRLIETDRLIGYPANDNKLPTVTLIMHKYLADENSIETSIAVSIDRSTILEQYNNKPITIKCLINDGYNYDPYGVTKALVIKDSIGRDALGYIYYGSKSDRFEFPVAPSLNGFPYDNIRIKPMVSLYINNENSNFNFYVQKRISGRLLAKYNKDPGIIELTRTSTEKYLVMISSSIFILLSSIVVYQLIKTQKKIKSIDGLIAVAGFILAISGFRDLIGLTRTSGTSALEILVIIIPLISIFSGLTYSYFKK